MLVTQVINYQEVPLRQLTVGDYFGEAALLAEDGLRTANVLTLSFVDLQLLTRRQFQRLRREHEDFGRVVQQLSDARAAAPRTGGQRAKKKREAWLARALRRSRTARRVSTVVRSARSSARRVGHKVRGGASEAVAQGVTVRVAGTLVRFACCAIVGALREAGRRRRWDGMCETR